MPWTLDHKFGNFRLPYVTIHDKVFNEEEVDYIIESTEADLTSLCTAGVGDGRTELEVRNSNIIWIPPTQNTRWMFERFSAAIACANYQSFLFDIDNFPSLQYTIYKPNQHYNWHYDTEPEVKEYERKMSAVMFLTGPDEYEGGELEIVNSGSPEKTMKVKGEKGSIVFFASWMCHKSHPVISGTKKSLVAWVLGPRHW